MRIAPVLAVLALLASGCIQGDSGIDVGLPATHGDAAGTAAGHGSPNVRSNEVTIEHSGARYIAHQTVLVDNGFGGADQAAVTLSTFNGEVAVAGTTDSSYHGTVRLQGSGTTEQMARDALASMRVDTPDKLSGVSLDFGILVRTTTTIPREAGRGASIDLTTPKGPAYNLGADSSNGQIDVHGLRGDVFKLDTSNGQITVHDLATRTLEASTSNGEIDVGSFVASDVNLDTSNGQIGLDGQADTVRADTSNGGIEGTLGAVASGTYTLSTSNGDVSLKLKGDSTHGFDASSDTSNGRATVSLLDGQAVGDQTNTHQHQRTSGFEGKAIRTVVTAESSNSDSRISQE